MLDHIAEAPTSLEVNWGMAAILCSVALLAFETAPLIHIMLIRDMRPIPCYPYRDMCSECLRLNPVLIFKYETKYKKNGGG
jgi:hypothetical protein